MRLKFGSKRKIKSKHRGDSFENILKGAANQSRWAFLKIPDGCRLTPRGLIRVKTPFDFVMIKKIDAYPFPVSLFCDAKTTLENTFCYSKVTPHQRHYLEQMAKHSALSGYIVNFAKINMTVFFTAHQLTELKPRESLKPDDGLRLGSNLFIDLNKLIYTESNET